MLTSKQRAFLRGLANTEDTIVQIGKGGITESVALQASSALKARELIKCKILENCPLSVREACDELTRLCLAEPVQIIGKKFVIYKKNHEEPKIIIPK